MRVSGISRRKTRTGRTSPASSAEQEQESGQEPQASPSRAAREPVRVGRELDDAADNGGKTSCTRYPSPTPPMQPAHPKSHPWRGRSGGSGRSGPEALHHSDGVELLAQVSVVVMATPTAADQECQQTDEAQKSASASVLGNRRARVW